MEQPTRKKRKIMIESESSTKTTQEKMKVSISEASGTTTDEILNRLVKCFLKGKKKFAKAGILFEKLLNSSMNEANSKMFVKALDEAMRDRTLWTDPGIVPVLSSMIRAMSEKVPDNENVRAYNIAVCIGSSFLTDDSFEYSRASKSVVALLQNRKPGKNRAATKILNDRIMQEAIVTALSQAFKQCRGMKAYRQSYKVMIEEAQKVRGTFQEDMKHELDKLSEGLHKLLNAPTQKKRAWTSDDYLKKTHPLRK